MPKGVYKHKKPGYWSGKKRPGMIAMKIYHAEFKANYVIPEFFTCYVCKIEKHKSEFPNTTNGLRGYQGKCKKCNNEWMRKDRLRRPDAYRNQDMKKYGITLEEYIKLCEKQNNVCAICGEKEKRKKGRLHVDHDHGTGRVRGLLCTNCNLGIGNLKHNPEYLKQAVKYLGGDAR